MRKIKLNPTKAVLMAYIIKNNIYDILWRQVSYKIQTLYKKEKKFSLSVNMQDSKNLWTRWDKLFGKERFYVLTSEQLLLTRFFKVASNKNVTFLVPPLSQQCLLHILDLLQGDLNVHAPCLKTSFFPFMKDHLFIFDFIPLVFVLIWTSHAW